MEQIAENQKRVCTLLSTYNGEKFLKPLLDTLVEQKGIEHVIVARDDGSKDSTAKILQQYFDEGKIHKLMIEQNVGFARSFHKLLAEAEPADYYAFSDQDDLWDEDKLLSGVKALEKEDDSIPLVYWCAFRSIDKNDKVYKESSERIKFDDSSDCFLRALNTNDIRGCTCVFNNKAREMMLSLEEGSYRYHDWIIQLIACEFGKELYDPTPHIGYRSHDTNCFGPAIFSFSGIKRAIRYVFKVELNNNRSKQAKEFLDAFGDKMSENHRIYLENAVKSPTDKKARKALLSDKAMFKTMPFYWRQVIRFAIRHGKY